MFKLYWHETERDKYLQKLVGIEILIQFGTHERIYRRKKLRRQYSDHDIRFRLAVTLSHLTDTASLLYSS